MEEWYEIPNEKGLRHLPFPSSQRSIVELVWRNPLQLTITLAMLQEKASSLSKHLGMSDESYASTGFITRFKERHAVVAKSSKQRGAICTTDTDSGCRVNPL